MRRLVHLCRKRYRSDEGRIGRKGHIAIGTNYIGRAMAYLEARRVEFNMETAKYDGSGG